MSSSIDLIGSGLAGALMSLYLAQAGYRVDLFERRSDLRKVSQSAGRSINLALSARGLHALAEVGLKDAVMQQALPMRGRMMHDPAGQLTFQPYGLHPHEAIYSISRGFLNEVLMDAAEASGRVSIHFEQRCLGMDLSSGTVQMQDLPGNRHYSLSGKPVIGADGAGSALRQSLISRLRVNYAQDYLDHGYKELTLSPNAQGGFQLDPEALHIWPRQRFMLIALPNPDASFTCTLFLPFESGADTPGFDQLSSPAAISAFFESHFGDLPPLMPDLVAQFEQNPTSVLSTIRLGPWYHSDRLLLIGDAAHAIVPFFGQGMNAAFEDCSLLAECLRGQPADLESVFADFYRARKPDADAIAEMALENFIEMRDKVADPAFLLRRQVGLLLAQRYPDVFVPKYSLVSFHRVPYALALAHGNLQQTLLLTLCEGLQQPEDLDWQQAEALVQQFRREAPALNLSH